MSGYKRVNFYELCRLCATNQQKEKTHIFQEEGRKIQLQNKIQSCLSLKVCENDFLPKVVCSQCLHSLEECCLFRKECYSSETMLSSYFNNFRYTDDFKKSGKVYIKDTTPKVSAPLTTACNTVATNSSYNISVVPPNSNCITQDPLPYYTLQLPTVVSQPQEPKIPPKELKAQPQIIYNLNTIKTATPSVVKDNGEQVGNITINSNGEIVTLAPYLDVNTVVSQTFSQKGRKLPKKPKSNLTEKIDIPTIDLTADLKYKEKFKSQPKINTKNAPLVNSSELNVLNPQSMILTQTPSSTLNINRTQKFFSYSTNVDLITPENITNINPEPPPINVSSYNYASTKQDVHTISTELYNQNQLACNANQQDYVATTGNQNYALVNGKQEVVKHHSCDICGKMFKRREHLYQHMKLHTGFRPFVCENCNKSFLRKEHLLRHMIAHSGQKNYTCTICDKSFSRNDNLLKHKKIHSKQSSFTCEVCQKQFVMEHYYFAHKRTHENEKCSQMWGGLLKAI